jgi:phage shock protein E
MENVLYWFVPALLLLGLLFWKRGGQISSDDAKRLLSEGATVVDVRTPAEYSEDHVRGALNLPLNQLAERIDKTVPDKGKPLLLHCHSGGRSAIARARLKSLGFEHVHNLGGLARARKIVEG